MTPLGDIRMKFLTVALALTIISGCATAPSQGYRPANYSGSPWNITGELNELTGGVMIKINNQVVISDRVSIFTGSGEFSGAYESKPVNASCMTSMGLLSTKTNCFVFVSGERAATLTF